ncbi:MAG: hypothetical protein EHM67_15500 [Hyphomicrobiaceae bacterium]|nr:MAG: hypothetical protein EHM67_15500 [Hyphomicrobiaceae bacterium]
MQQGGYEAGIARMNAQMERAAAQDSINTGQLERRNLWRNVGMAKGQQAASMGANGIDLGFGSALRQQEDTQMLANEDATNLHKGIEERTKGRIINASNFTQEARAAKQRGKSALIGSVFDAGSSLLGGFQQQAGIRAKTGQTGVGTGKTTGVAPRGPSGWNRGR